MTAAYTNPAHTAAHALGQEQSVWFKLTPLLYSENPMQVLRNLAGKYGGVIPINLKTQKVLILNDVDHFRRVLIDNADNYDKYFDGLRPVFGRSMITIDGALWQKVRKPQQPAFHTSMFEEYFPYLMTAIHKKLGRMQDLARKGDVFELVEETWTLAADMVCKALFDRDMPFNPHFIFGCVKSYTDVMAHKSIRLRKVSGELVEVTKEDAAQAMDTWAGVPDVVLGVDPHEHRERTLLTMLQDARNDPDFPEFDHQQVVDEMKQYLWAGTETTALTLAWAIYICSTQPEIAEAVRREGEETFGDREPTWEDLQKLNYTRRVLQETMRMYPPIWALIRVASGDDHLGEHDVRAGDKIVVCSYVAHFSEKYWDDPETFDPDRFLPDQIRARAKYCYLPFGAGKRSCIGGQLSLVENTLALQMLLKRFRPEYAGEKAPGLNATVTLTPKGGLPFRIHTLS